jgi:hypothetical protein
VIPNIGCKEPIVYQYQIGSKYLNKVHISDGNINFFVINKLTQSTTIKFSPHDWNILRVAKPNKYER